MPFTGSHPAAVLPLLRTRLMPSALVVGSMVPDLPYYLPLPTIGNSHSLVGVVTVDLLLGAVALILWHTLLAPFAASVAPATVRSRLGDHVPVPAGRPLRSRRAAVAAVTAAVSLAVGALTHVVWDSFTHAGRWCPDHISWLAESHAGLAGYRWAQYTSGILGAAAIIGWLVRWWRTTPPATDRNHQQGPTHPAFPTIAWTIIGLATTATATATALTTLNHHDTRRALFLITTRPIGAGLAASLGCALYHHLSRARRPKTNQHRPTENMAGPS